MDVFVVEEMVREVTLEPERGHQEGQGREQEEE